MKIIKTYIVWLTEHQEFAKLHLTESSDEIEKMYFLEGLKGSMEEVSKEFVEAQNWII